jgi:acetyl-CoA carboxylase biotin carboxyl carrier protein
MNLPEIKALIAVMAEYGLAEMTVSENGWTLRLVRDAATQVATPQPQPSLRPHAATVNAPSPVPETFAPDAAAIEAPLAGIIHFRPAPEAPPFVEVGQPVRAGDTICLVEAMKVFIPVCAQHDGVVAAILVPSGAEVAAGAPLVRLA